jgi:hypothetical protein
MQLHHLPLGAAALTPAILPQAVSQLFLMMKLRGRGRLNP